MTPKSTTPIHVLLITARSDLGGGPRHILDLLHACEGNEFKFSIASPNDEPFASRFRDRVSGFINIPARKFSLSALWAIRDFVINENVDIIHSHGRGAGIYSRLLGWLTKRPVVHTFHGVHAETNFMGRIKLLIDQALAYLPFQAIFVSENEREKGRGLRVVRDLQDQAVILNAVDENRFQIDLPQPQKSHAFRVGIFLRPDPAKGPDLFLDSARRILNEKGSGIEFTCAGATREELSARNEVDAQIEFTGSLKEPAQWLKSLDLYVSFSRVEGLPLGVLEALACGVPCLLSDIPAHQSFVAAGAAVNFCAEDPLSFRESLFALKQSPARREEMSRIGRELITTKHSLSAFKTQLQAIYRQVARTEAQRT